VTGGQDLRALLGGYSEAVAGELRAAAATRHDLGSFYGMLHYHKGWVDSSFAPEAGSSGKGLRSAFCLLCCEVCGGQQDDALSVAAAIDLLHNFSLIHDDIEDNSDTRRHRRTVWSLWGAPQGINLGDGVFALAMLAFFRSPLVERDPARFLTLQREAQETILTLAEGQYLDISFETRLQVSAAEYLAMIERKSAALIAYAAWAGATAAGAPPATCAALRAFGRELGLAFQIRDDLLGIWGDEAVTGKSRASDILSRKKTLPVVLAFDNADPEQARRLRSIYGSADPIDDDTLAAVLALLEATGAHALAGERLAQHRRAAEEALGQAGLSGAPTALLMEFAQTLVERAS